MARQTAQRTAIRRVLEEADRPMSPAEVLEAARLIVPQLGLTTVYRTVNSLVETNWLAPVHLPGEATRYECAGKPLHYFFRCRGCGCVFDVPGRQTRLNEVVPPGFVASNHEVFFYGLCKACSVPGQREADYRDGSGGGREAAAEG